jgi:pilus assembly protein Flp/PilA
MKALMRRLFFPLLSKEKESGQGLVEYALILVLVAVVVIVILQVLGPAIGNVFSRVNATFSGNLPCEVTLTNGSRISIPTDILSKTTLSGSGFAWGGGGNNTLSYTGAGLPYPSIANFTSKTFNADVSVARNCSGYANKG